MYPVARYMEYWVPSGRALAAIGHQYSTVVGALVEQGAGGTSIQVHPNPHAAAGAYAQADA